MPNLQFLICKVDLTDLLICFFRDGPTRSHLKNVYAALTLSMFLAAGGAGVHLFTDVLKVCMSIY